MIKVHFTGWSYKYDECIDVSSNRLIKQWRRGIPFQLHNRLDVKDVKGKWLEAHIVEIYDENRIRVHFKNWSSKWDEEVDVSPSNLDIKYAEIGLYSNGYGYAKFHSKEILNEIISGDESQTSAIVT